MRVIGNGAFGKKIVFEKNKFLGFVFESYDVNRKCKVAVKRTQKMGNIISREYLLLDMLKGKENVI